MNADEPQQIEDYPTHTPTQEPTGRWKTLKTKLFGILGDCMNEKEQKPKQPTLSAKTKALLRNRKHYTSDPQKFAEMTKHIRKSKREDNKQRMMDKVSQELDERDIWMGVRSTHRGYKITPYGKKRKMEN